jgi:hypothetical protein
MRLWMLPTPKRVLNAADDAGGGVARGDPPGKAHGLPVVRPWQDATALAVAGYLEKVFGGWRPPSIVTTVA